MNSLRELGGEAWFQPGDRDLALHIQRIEMRAGMRVRVPILDQIDEYHNPTGQPGRIAAEVWS